MSASFEHWPLTHIRGKHLERHSDCKAQAKRPVFHLMLLFSGSEIRHTVSKATTFDHLGNGGWVMAYEMLIKQITYIRGDVSQGTMREDLSK